ncbi:MAG: phospholipase D-like domain-containing protein [Nibricoccus sp.]
MDLLRNLVDHPVLPHLFTIGGFLLAFFLVARLLAEKRQPGNTVAWLLVIVLVPYVGVPLYLLFGGRKLQRLIARKSLISPTLDGSTPPFDITGQLLPTVQTINASGACPPTGGNKVELVASGEEMFTLLSQQIREAKHSIHITTFILGRDETGKKLVRLLASRAREGVKVRLLLDAVGCMFSRHGFVKPLREAGGEVATFLPVLPLSFRRSANLRNHRKIAVFDQHTAIVGGHNLAREYMGPTPWRKRWRDFGAVISGPCAALLNEVFLADWAFASRQSLDRLHKENIPEARRPEGNSSMQVVVSGPDVHGDPLYEGIISMIQEARTSIWIITPYFIPDEVVFRSLMVKARAGIEVVVIVPARSNHPITDFARRHYLRELQQAGARVMNFGPGMMHSKAILIDERIGMLGSANFDLRSLFVNFEIGVLLYSESDVAAMKAWARDLLNSCREPKKERRKKFRVVGNVLEDLSRLLAPLL